MVHAVDQSMDDLWYHLRGMAHVETTTMALDADSIDYNRDTEDAVAEGNVRFKNFVTGETLHCDRAEYNTGKETGKFYAVNGTSPPKIDAKPGLLTTTNPFYFQAMWAERIQERYILHEGFVTNCKVPKPWWTLRAKKFNIIPGERALAYSSVFRVRWLPLFYTPWYYKSLKRNPRQSGLLTPSIGNSSLRGQFFGAGYYWAIDPSMDFLYRIQYYTIRGFAHDGVFRWRVRRGTSLDATIYGVQDRGVPNEPTEKFPGYRLTVNGRSDLGDGWYARGTFNYLSSFEFLQQFADSFHEAIGSESDSIGFVTKHVDTWGVNVLADRIQNFDFNPSQPDGAVVIRHLPEGEFLMHETPVPRSPVPVWFSVDSSAGLVDRSEPATPGLTTIGTSFVDRLDVQPRITSDIRLYGFSLVPSFSVDETEYGAGLGPLRTVSAGLLRNDREFTLDLIPPSLEHIYNAPGWLGKKLKHVIEPEVEFRYVGGIGTDVLRTIYFDELETMNDTKELRVSLTNRLYVKKKDNHVDEILSWQVSQVRYFDPTFGGAVVPGQLSVIWSSLELTPFSFIDSPRNYSPITSVLRFQEKIGLDWQTDYDPMRHGFTDSIVNADFHFSRFFLALGHSLVREPLAVAATAILSPTTDQFRGTFGFGQSNRRGINSAVTWFYDYRQNLLTYIAGQVTYNTNCCGFGMEFRETNWRGGLAIQNSTDVRFAFTVANMGSFGTLRRQDRLF